MSGNFNQFISFFTWIIRTSRCNNTADAATCFQSTAKYLEFRISQFRRQVNQFHPKSHIGFIDTKSLHGFCIFQFREWYIQILIQGLFKYVFKQFLVYFIYLFRCSIAHFHIQLSKFRLSVCSQVFIPETACYLKIAVKTWDHQQLFIYLRRLRQGKKLTILDSTGNQVISRSFWCTLH